MVVDPGITVDTASKAKQKAIADWDSGKGEFKMNLTFSINFALVLMSDFDQRERISSKVLEVSYLPVNHPESRGF